VIAPIGDESIKWRLLLLGVTSPLIGVSIGVDGGDIFQMLAVETLALDPRAVGTALLFGALSIPIQIWAARIPLERARHNIRIFILAMGAMALISSILVLTATPGSGIAGTVLIIAVVAEIAVSVLFATAHQPIISYTLTVDQRQFINGPARAVAGLVILLSAVVFGQLPDTGRAVFLAALSVAALAVGWSLRILPPPPATGSDTESGPADTDTGTSETGSEIVDAGRATDPTPGQQNDASTGTGDGSLTNVFLALPAAAFASWPLLISYAAVTLLPEGNLGLLAGAMMLGSVVASALWRDPGHRLIPIIRAAAAVVAICSIIIVALDGPDRRPAVITLFVAITVGAAARTTLRAGIMELAHRRIDTTNSVRVMTMIDVVGSTSFQVGAFVAGFLIAASRNPANTLDLNTGVGSLDLYELWLLATAVILVLVATRFRARPATTAD
jgi:hypothetical protein